MPSLYYRLRVGVEDRCRAIAPPGVRVFREKVPDPAHLEAAHWIVSPYRLPADFAGRTRLDKNELTYPVRLEMTNPGPLEPDDDELSLWLETVVTNFLGLDLPDVAEVVMCSGITLPAGVDVVEGATDTATLSLVLNFRCELARGSPSP